MRTTFIAASITALSLASAAGADIITQWNYNALPLGVNNNPAPSTGFGSSTPVGMNGGLNNADIVAAADGSDLGVPNRGWRVRGSQNNGWSGTVSHLSGAQWNASTAGSPEISVTLDIHATDGAPRHAQFQYTTDGTNFVNFGSLLDFNTTFDHYVPFTFDLSSLAGVGNNANFGFRIVSAFSPVEFTNANGVQPANTAFQRASGTSQVYNGTAGNYRFDMVTINSVPAPAAAGLMGLAGLVSLRRRR